MKRSFALAILAAVSVATILQTQDASAQQSLPSWAFPMNPPGVPPAGDDGMLHRVPSSAATFSRHQLSDLFNAPDWYPEDHAPMPGIVSQGRKPAVYACGYCHLPTGNGRPENASLAGLPADYIARQMADFKSGARKTTVPARLPAVFMVSVAKAATDDEIAAAAVYFSSLKPKSYIRVVETNSVPKTYVTGWVLAKSKNGGTEPIGQRIVEVPEDVDRFELRDGRTEYIAYVPVGSIGQGATLVKTGGAGKTILCASCHGPELNGLGLAPRIIGRSPSYIVRQLYDIKSGVRAGVNSQLMKPVVANLSNEDMVSIAAYLASRSP